MTAPVVLFTYCRQEHTQKTVESLRRNLLATDTDLIIYSDAAASPVKELAVERVRSYLKTISGFRSITIHHRVKNLGLANSIISGVTEVLRQYESIIVLEDDIVTSPYFLTYMNDALVKYKDIDSVVSIHGYVIPTEYPLPETFFMRGADCWGWATWGHAWSIFNSDGKYLLNELKRRKLIFDFDFSGLSLFSNMLKDQCNGKNDSWAVRWYASAFLAEKLTLYPGRSLVQNIGNDNSGTHCGNTTDMDVELSAKPIKLFDIPVEPSHEARQAYEGFFKQGKKRIFTRVIRRIKALTGI